MIKATKRIGKVESGWGWISSNKLIREDWLEELTVELNDKGRAKPCQDLRAEESAKCEGPEVRKLVCVRHSRGAYRAGEEMGRGAC